VLHLAATHKLVLDRIQHRSVATVAAWRAAAINPAEILRAE
jgi:hypothetical protein